MTHVTDWLQATGTDVLLLQELKATEFPTEAFRELGYESVAVCQKSYNGVAILSKLPIETVSLALPGGDEDTHARYLESIIDAPFGRVRVVCVYLPNGNPVGTPKFAYKLGWMERFMARAKMLVKLGEPVVLAGDYNIIPTERDVYKPERWQDDALFQPEPRAQYAKLLKQGWTDALRHLHPDETIFTFWDYWRQSFARNAGIRIDHLLLNKAAAKRLKAAQVDRDTRGREKASDHAPVWIELAGESPATSS